MRAATNSCRRFPLKMTEQIDLVEFGQYGNCYCILLGKWSSPSSLAVVQLEEGWCTADCSRPGVTGTSSKFGLKDLTGGAPHFIFAEHSLCLKIVTYALGMTWDVRFVFSPSSMFVTFLKKN